MDQAFEISFKDRHGNNIMLGLLILNESGEFFVDTMVKAFTDKGYIATLTGIGEDHPLCDLQSRLNAL